MTKATKTSQNKKSKSQKSGITMKKEIVVTKNQTQANRKPNYIAEMQKLNRYTTKVNRNKVRSFDADINKPEFINKPDFTAIENNIKRDGKFVY